MIEMQVVSMICGSSRHSCYKLEYPSLTIKLAILGIEHNNDSSKYLLGESNQRSTMLFISLVIHVLVDGSQGSS
jgi:hypothetical protein